MHRPRRTIVAATIAALAMSSLTPAAARAGTADRPPGGDRQLLRMIGSMTLEEKAAQLFVLQVYGKSADTTDPADVARNQKLYGLDNAAQLITRYQPGGIIYYSADPPNVDNPKQVAAFSNGIQRAAKATRLHIPATIATDQEGGIVARLQPPATQSPGSMALAAGRRPNDARTLARITGQELRAVGINTDYAPDSDVNSNPANPVIGVRSFGSDPSLVSKFVTSQIDGYRSGNVTATVKHFPGHGDTSLDSHISVPRVEHTRAQWEKTDLPPFKAAIARGVDSIMTAHIIYPALDPSEDPSTLSKPIVTGILRDKLHYNGVVITDALDMQGVRDKYGDDRVPVLALKAGVDVLLKPPSFDANGNGVFRTQLNAVVNAVRSGELSEKRIDQSVYRILALKKKRGLFRNPFADESKIDQVVGTPRHLADAQRATDPTTTLVKNDAKLLPLKPGARKVLVAGWGVTTTKTIADTFTAHGATAGVQESGVSPTPERIQQTVAAAKDQDLIVAVTNRAWDIKASLPAEPHNGPGQMNLVKALVATGKPVVVIAARDPYDIAYFPEATTYLATYSYTAEALRSVGKVLFGEMKPAGKLPVVIPSRDDPDKALYPFGHGLSY
ncbi:glycoside hydrolase family 3 protein [Actinomadura barringtoniae]|uniref:beta-N-acetylhexosaminidase n=1 Tax=Actinomadura barringtoniae TaxID=1427535 RepID=A0A939T8H1_9ACTN|nr:glycoside hydrolase family 3 protein [Actinomadura barringtoniae]MBO2454133.1 glycoside hydrolase family 3 protein [Actinomadura barringtoniae]